MDKKNKEFIVGEIYDYIPTLYAEGLGDSPGSVEIIEDRIDHFECRILEGIDNYSKGEVGVILTVGKGSPFSEGLYLAKPTFIESGLALDDIFDGVTV